jgi:hypothetical protein
MNASFLRDRLPSATFAILALVVGVLPLGGCRICANCDDLAYPAYGGAWERTNREQGRVGSMFDPGGARSAKLVSRETPQDPDEIERQRQQESGEKSTDVEKQREQEKRELEKEKEQSQDDDKDPEKKDDLRDQKLDDIEVEGEEDLRKKSLDEINIRIIPGRALPPAIK